MLIRLRLFLLLLAGLLAAQVQAQTTSAPLADTAAARPASLAGTKKAALLRIAVPSVLIGVGVLAHSPKINQTMCQAKQDLQAETQELFRGFNSYGVDDYTRHVPLAMAYGMMATGHPGERTALGFTLIYLVAHELDEGVVSHLKRYTAEPRPYNPQDLSSFPSSHTSQAFLTATLLHEQYGRRYPWLSVSGYAVATATGAMRVMGNKHWVTDVLAGAAIGFLSAETVWHAYPALTKLLPQKVAHKLLLVPSYTPAGGAGFAMGMQL